MPNPDPARRLEQELADAVTTGVKPTDYAQPHVRAAAAGDRRLAIASSSPTPAAADTPAAANRASPAGDHDRLSNNGGRHRRSPPRPRNVGRRPRSADG